MKRHFLLLLVTAVLLSLACGLVTNLVEPTEQVAPTPTSQPPPAPTPSPSSVEPTLPPVEPAPPSETDAPPTETSPAPMEPPAARLEVVELSELDSYRLVQTVRLETDNRVITNTHILIWTKRPLAYHHIYIAGAFDNDVWSETIKIEGQAWLWTRGGEWTEIAPGDISDPFDLLPTRLVRSYAPTMEFVEMAEVRGVTSRHYTQDMSTSVGPGRFDVWVAAREDFPLVVIRTVLYMVGEMQTSLTQHNVYDLNEPILIRPPE
jgi:hypothetical protein